MADGNFTDHVMQNIAFENLRNQAHAFMGMEEFAIGGDNAGALLASMLESIETIVRQFRGVWMTINAKDATVMFWVALHRSRGIIPRPKEQIQQGVESHGVLFELRAVNAALRRGARRLCRFSVQILIRHQTQKRLCHRTLKRHKRGAPLA
jgi:hypothetical protein